MKLRLTILTVAALLSACAGTPEQQTATKLRRGKNVAKLEKIGWNALGFTSRLAENFLINSASQLAREQGFRK